MILVYCDYITPRLEYIFSFILKEICCFSYTLVTDKDAYSSYTGPSINYSSKSIKENEIKINPAKLLFENDVKEQVVRVSVKEEQTEIFIGENDEQDKDFDLFAASFYINSRYEEYLSFIPDSHGNFEAHNSFLSQHRLLLLPLVDCWSRQLKETITKKYQIASDHSRVFQPVMTIDVDQAYAFQNRGIFRNAISFCRNMIKFNFNLLLRQFKTIILKHQDPYDTFSYLQQLQETYRLKFIYFINVGHYGKYDKNISIAHPRFQQLLEKIKSYAVVGLHPSYYSNEQPSKIIQEKIRLEKILNEDIEKSRQHFLKIKMPHTYRKLIEAGIKEDYSMGYNTYPGFRAGTCTPFFWFDLEKNQKTNLKIYPITFMDGTLLDDMKLGEDKAMNYIQHLLDTVRRYNGCFVSIWHNHTVSDKLYWAGWRKIFERTIQKIYE